MPSTADAAPDAVPSPSAFAASSRQAAENAPVRRRTASSQLHRLAAFHSLPEALRDNDYITKYYRVNYSAKQTIRSLFSLHNETGNIWSHFIGFMLFVALTVATIYAQPAPVALGTQKLVQLEQLVVSAGRSGWQEALRAEHSVAAGLRSLSQHVREGGWEGLLEDLRGLEARVLAYGSDGLSGLEGRYGRLVASLADADWPTQRWPIYVFMAGAMTCLFTSSFCHLFGCCSWHFAQAIWKYDYAGIVVLIVTSFMPPVYYGFLCQPLLRNFYLISTVSLGVFTTCVTLLPFFQTKRFRPFRAGLFAGLGLWGIFPATHAIWLHGAAPAVRRFFVLDMLMGAVYLLGAAIYALRVPERWRPGAFDLWCSSHQLFHLCVVTAALIHYVGVHALLDWRDATGGCAYV